MQRYEDENFWQLTTWHHISEVRYFNIYRSDSLASSDHITNIRQAYRNRTQLSPQDAEGHYITLRYTTLHSSPLVSVNNCVSKNFHGTSHNI